MGEQFALLPLTGEICSSEAVMVPMAALAVGIDGWSGKPLNLPT
jgi:hypothetical protein